ncbi:MAG: hypothetical protein LBK73_07990 [Treponema sp.]|nr:hypothetical protein [Treponema sp.]
MIRWIRHCNTPAATGRRVSHNEDEVQLKLIDAMFSDATAGEIADISANFT